MGKSSKKPTFVPFSSRQLKDVFYPKEYDEYLQSEHWLDFREEVLEWWHHRCALCSSDQRLHVHHRTYENLGEEKLSDCIVLCRSCHKMLHRMLHRRLKGRH